MPEALDEPDPPAPAAASTSDAEPSAPPLVPAVPFLNYSSRPPPPSQDTAMMDFGHAIGAMVLYFAMVGAMKVASMRWRWDVGGICGTWVAILILNFGLAGWMYGAYGWRGVMVGTFIAAVISLVAAPLVLAG